MSQVIEATFFRTRRRRVAFSATPPPNHPAEVRRASGAAYALALARELNEAIEGGRLPWQSAVAELLGFTRPRVTQLLQLTLLAPDLQEAVAFGDATDGREPISERALRHVAAALSWVEQRRRFAEVSLRAGRAPLRSLP